MTLIKAIKRLEQKGTGFVFRIEEMEKNFAPDIFINGIQTHGYLLRKNNSNPRFYVDCFKLKGEGEPIQYLDFDKIERGPELEMEEAYTQGWAWYSFGELFQKFGKLYLHFGFDDIVHKEPEKMYDIYR